MCRATGRGVSENARKTLFILPKTGLTVGLLAFCMIGSISAASSLQLRIDSLRYGPLILKQAKGAIFPRQGEFSLSLGELRLPVPPYLITQTQLACRQGDWIKQTLICSQGRIQIHLPKIREILQGPFAARLSPKTGTLKLSPLQFMGGHWELALTYLANRWRSRLKARQVHLRKRTIKALSPQPLPWLETLQGKANFSLRAAGNPQPYSMKAQLQIHPLSFNDRDFTLGAENLKIAIQTRAKRKGRRWQGDLTATIDDGSWYLPFYLPFKQHPSRLHWQFEWNAKNHKSKTNLTFSQRDIFRVFVKSQKDNGIISSLVANIEANLASAFKRYVSPYLEGGNWEGVSVPSGKGIGKIMVRNNWPESGQLKLIDIIIADSQRRLGFRQLQGDIHWRRRLATQGQLFPLTWIGWQSGHLYKIPLGKSDFFFRTTGDDLRLIRPATIPILDGYFQIRQLQALDLTSDKPQFQFAGKLKNIPLEKLTRVIGLPPLAGTLSGVIPKISYRPGELKLEGKLLLEVFDGEIVIQNLKISHLFGPLPRLEADMAIKNLDLELVTRHFDFGLITGRLDGYIKGLVLENWRPVAFDAWLGTPENDDSKHRISQKAVENLTDLGGGGAAGLLSQGFMKLFKQFSYHKIGIGCRLQNNICFLSGAAPANNGYYIVKGGGLPRIDVIGYNRRIDWPTLLARLARITQIEKLESPVITP